MATTSSAVCPIGGWWWAGNNLASELISSMLVVCKANTDRSAKARMFVCAPVAFIPGSHRSSSKPVEVADDFLLVWRCPVCHKTFAKELKWPRKAHDGGFGRPREPTLAKPLQSGRLACSASSLSRINRGIDCQLV